jgi:hypothetical protein
VDRVPEAGHEPLLGLGNPDRLPGDLVPLVLGIRLGCQVGQDAGQVAAGVLGDAEEPGAAAKEASGQGAPGIASGALRYVRRAAMAVGVKPWSASPSITASKSVAFPGRKGALASSSTPRGRLERPNLLGREAERRR